MLVESLFNTLGELGVLVVGVLCVALPLALAGLALRRFAMARRQRWQPVVEAQRPLREARKGRVSMAGTWRSLGDRQGVLEADGVRVLVDLGDAALPNAAAAPLEGARVLVSGWATREVDDPRGADYRSGARVWLVEGAGEPVVISEEHVPARSLRRARVLSGMSLGVLALALAAMVSTGALCYRATHEPWEPGGADFSREE